MGIVPYFVRWSISNNKSVSHSISNDLPINNHGIVEKFDKYAVFCANTPNGEGYRSYDYAYNLPLTALAWERIGYKSIVLIIGYRCEWENDPALIHVLSHLEERDVKTIFLNSPLKYRTTLSQTARAFAVNIIDFPIKDNDYLITTDSDLWPLRMKHFIPRENASIVLIHADCCGFFNFNNVSYPLYPMSNIGAKVSTWREIMNENHTFANNSESILDYLEDVFGKPARNQVVVGEDSWYMDQRMISIRITEWIAKFGNSSVFRVSDDGFYRVDRSQWDSDLLLVENLSDQFDAHLITKGYLPLQQKRIKPLIDLMYGKNSSEAKWCSKYNEGFLSKVRNYLRFNHVN